MNTSRRPDHLKTYQLWRSEKQGSFTFIEEGADVHASILEPDARLIWTVEAANWDEANIKKHQHLGWEPYHPLKDK